MLLLSDTLGDTGRQLAGGLDQPQQQGLVSPQGPSATGTQGHSRLSPCEPNAVGTRGHNGPSACEPSAVGKRVQWWAEQLLDDYAASPRAPDRRKHGSNDSSYVLGPESGDGVVYDGCVGGTGNA